MDRELGSLEPSSHYEGIILGVEGDFFSTSKKLFELWNPNRETKVRGFQHCGINEQAPEQRNLTEE